MSQNERTIKVVVVAVAARKYPRHEVRVVECEYNQCGHASERGVKTLWCSRPLYRIRTKSGRGQGPAAIRTAQMIANTYREKVGLAY